MKKSLLAIALAVGTMPLMFAAPAATTKTDSSTTATKTKKTKKNHKGKKHSAPATSSNPAK